MEREGRGGTETGVEVRRVASFVGGAMQHSAATNVVCIYICIHPPGTLMCTVEAF